MFSVVSVCWRRHETITHDALDFTVQRLMPDMFKLVQLLGPHCTGTHARPCTSLRPCTETVLSGPALPLVLTSAGY